MSDDDTEGEPPSLLDAIEHAQGLLEGLKSRVIAAGENSALAASSILAENSEAEGLSRTILWLRGLANETSTDVFDDLLDSLHNFSNANSDAFLDNRFAEEFWEVYHNKLKDIGKADVRFRRKCFFRTIGGDKNSLFHEVCKYNPPMEVVETLIQIMPTALKLDDDLYNTSLYPREHDREHNHLARNGDFGEGEFPLHMVMRHGGTIELVKLLINATASSAEGDEKEKEGLLSHLPDCDSLLHVLVANKASHDPDEFSLILRFLVLNMGRNKMDHITPLNRFSSSQQIPVGVLWQSLKEEKLSDSEIFGNADFIFLLKATYYDYRRGYRHGCSRGTADYKQMEMEIEDVDMARAFLLSSVCFGRVATEQFLESLYLTNSNFFLEKDEDGVYFIHGLVKEEYRYILRAGYEFVNFVIETVVRIAPECARQTDEEGLLPLHIVADVKRKCTIAERDRLSRVKTLLKAYPEAVGTIDKVMGIPAFALPIRGKSENEKPMLSCFPWDEYCSISCAFLMLRQHPEILAKVSGRSICARGGDNSQPKTKRRRIDAPS